MGTTVTDVIESKSPKQSISPTRQGSIVSAKIDSLTKPDITSNAPATKPLAPPPRPGQSQQGSNTPEYFAPQVSGGSLSLEPNPFEQSFGGGGPETPGGTKLPSVAALTSPSSLLPGSNATPFNWGGGSLRTGPLSPAMLSGPTDYFGDTHHLRGGFPTPNESSLRTGLTPGGSGSMFPAPSPNSALFAQLASGGATPSTLDFHRTALSAAAKRDQASRAQQQQQPPAPQPPAVTSQPQDMTNGTVIPKVEPKSSSGPFDPHDNDAANGLFMLAQGRNGAQPTPQFTVTAAPTAHAHPAPAIQSNINTSPPMASVKVDSKRGASEISNGSDESDQKPQTRGKGKKNPPAANGRRKADEMPVKAPAAKKTKANSGAASSVDEEHSDEDMDKFDENGPGKSKMTDEEKRKNFLERNRVAALKCRQRKKQWLANLQTKVEMFSSENDALTQQITQLREEVVNLKTLLLAHKDCPVTQQQGLHGAFMSQVVEPFNPQMNPYGMAAPIPAQQAMVGQGVQRRFS
ncbi:transcription factor atf1 [Trichoderma asperellum]|uniref:Transcription factor atf1 n=1 Tax=Trichoderma asperellum TaxID=101201 RepID=A0A6V8QU37_TRIAP|nr:Aft1 HRA domain-containing protein [Trichoderma asperelloides]GFP56107.1 transcription factor atf1 [Trichoderma asperellum]